MYFKLISIHIGVMKLKTVLRSISSLKLKLLLYNCTNNDLNQQLNRLPYSLLFSKTDLPRHYKKIMFARKCNGQTVSQFVHLSLSVNHLSSIYSLVLGLPVCEGEVSVSDHMLKQRTICVSICLVVIQGIVLRHQHPTWELIECGQTVPEQLNLFLMS